ncbi:MAG: hypothetical protein KDD35_11740, partial [Bdellovibrionales bacterium]|nr:hypothetical protein [Bdellovibrionales bacterium]
MRWVMYCTADSFIQSTFKIILGFLAVLGMVFTLGVGAKPVKKMIHFVVVHKQDNSENMKLMSQFGERVEQRTSGEVAVQIEPGRYRLPSGKESGNGVGRAIVGVYGGQIQMSQVPIDRLLFLSTDIDVLDMPNIFTDHRHARQVLDGKVGSELQESLLKGSNNRVRGLAYTYSGGWRNIYSTKNIRFLKDL